MQTEYEIFKIVQKKYEIYVKVLGEGQYGRTHLAKNKENDEILACKIINKSSILSHLSSIENDQEANARRARILSRLQNEIDNTKKMSFRLLLIYFSKLEHQNIVKFENLVESSSNLYIFMELCGGGTLQRHLKQKNWYTEQEALPIFRQLTAGCMYLYDNDVIHRDLKPSNIIFGADNQIKIADFGLSKAIEKQMKDAEQNQTPWIGTPLYMSPQVIWKGIYSIKTDVWSLGCIFYQILYGIQPWYNDNVAILSKQILEDVLTFPKNPYYDVSTRTKELIQEMLQKDENLRCNIQKVSHDLNY